MNGTNSSLTVGVNNLPAVQQVSGSVAVDNLPAVQQVSGTVNVANLPGTASPFLDSTGNVSLGSMEETSFTIPAGVVITDLVASVGRNGDARCTIIVSQGEPTFANRMYIDTGLIDEVIQINLTSGWPGPLTVELKNSTSLPGVCSFVVTSSGFSTA